MEKGFRVALSSVMAVGLMWTFLASSGASATEFPVTVRDNEFDPRVLDSSGQPFLPGDSVRWTWAGDVSNPHDVTQHRGLFRSPVSSAPGFTFARTVSAGTFRYQCSIHGSAMPGVLRTRLGLGDLTAAGLPPIFWASADSNTGKAFDVQFRVGTGKWRTWKKDTTRIKAVFGRNDRPVRFNPGKDYWLRARSQKSLKATKKVSGWSQPTLID